MVRLTSVAVYGRNARWRRGLAKRLAEAGHVHGEVDLARVPGRQPHAS